MVPVREPAGAEHRSRAGTARAARREGHVLRARVGGGAVPGVAPEGGRRWARGRGEGLLSPRHPRHHAGRVHGRRAAREGRGRGRDRAPGARVPARRRVARAARPVGARLPRGQRVRLRFERRADAPRVRRPAVSRRRTPPRDGPVGSPGFDREDTRRAHPRCRRELPAATPRSADRAGRARGGCANTAPRWSHTSTRGNSIRTSRGCRSAARSRAPATTATCTAWKTGSAACSRRTGSRPRPTTSASPPTRTCRSTRPRAADFDTERILVSPAGVPAERVPVSVVVPCFNEEDVLPYLANTLERVADALADRYDIRFVLVDDGSTDHTWDGLTATFADRPNFDLVRHDKNRGVAAAIHDRHPPRGHRHRLLDGLRLHLRPARTREHDPAVGSGRRSGDRVAVPPGRRGAERPRVAAGAVARRVVAVPPRAAPEAAHVHELLPRVPAQRGRGAATPERRLPRRRGTRRAGSTSPAERSSNTPRRSKCACSAARRSRPCAPSSGIWD